MFQATSVRSHLSVHIWRKQYVAPRVTAAFSGNVSRVKIAGAVERAVPTASPPPSAPGEVIAILAVWIACFPGRTIDALVDWAGDALPGHRGSCQDRKNNSDPAQEFEFPHAFLPVVPVTQVTEYQQVPRLAPKRILMLP
jgi:hypothetical protein